MHAHALSSLGLRFSRALLLLALICYSFASARAAAAEIVVKNDTVFGPGYPAEPNPLPNVSWADLRLGTRLTSPVDGTIVGIQIAWGSQTGLAAPSVEGPIRISTLAVDPNDPPPQPDQTLATIDSPTLVDGIFNEFRHLDPATGLLPLSVPVSAGQEFFVDLQYAHLFDDEDPSLPGILMDQDLDGDITRDLFLFRFPQFGWVETHIGVSNPGNFGIRAIIQPVPEPSTCALAALGAIALLFAWRRKSLR
jgi:hypothetical protein